jgi:hypothetical protein
MDDILTTTRTVLATTPRRWIILADMLPAGLLNETPAPREWCAVECLQHIVDTERWVFPARVRALLAGQDFPAFDPDSQGSKTDATQSPSQLARDFATLRAESLILLAQVRDEDLPRQARHQELGMVTLSQLLHEWVAHDLNHTVQAERALMQPFIQGCGPWQSYFADHVIKPK